MDLVVDLGQSGARYKVGTDVVALSIAKNSEDPVVLTVEKIFQQIPKQEFSAVALSLTGLQGDVADPRPYGELSHKYFNSKNVCIMDDGIASYVGSLGSKSGIVLTLGGGVVAIAANGGHFGHADGKGPIFGDFGGGFWIGQSALSKAISTIDGRDNYDDLVELLKVELSKYRSLENKTGIEASLLCIETAKIVTKGAADGVISAYSILESGAKYLSATIESAWRKVADKNGQIPVLSIKGGLSQSKDYVQLIQKFTAERINFEYLETTGDNLAGATKAAEVFTSDVTPLLKWWRA
ncbi:MAG: BadF/BadG/BcrA/BcrD ATPase family protein [Candidatus Nanopelagicaceae bacterium]